jgi:hypothetical protein
MKESFEDRMTKRIKEVMEQYEPDYSPQAWEKFRRQMPVPELWLKRLFLKYKFWFSVVAIVGVFVMVDRDTSGLLTDENSAIDPLFSESVNYNASEKPKEITYSEKATNFRHNISDIDISWEEKNTSSKDTPARITDYLAAAYQDNAPAGNAIAEVPGSVERPFFYTVFLEGTDFGYQFRIPQLIPIKSQMEEIPVLESSSPALKSPSFEKTRNYKFQWPEINLITTKDDRYKKIAGPNKLALFYSTEIHQIHHNHSIKTLGVSHGIGISLEGPIRSSVSVSAGLSYQAINFNKIIFSETVYAPYSSQYPIDTINISYLIDSIGIRSGSYKYLEVPVSLNFKFFETIKSQAWLGTGISAMAFLKQNYTSETIVGGISERDSSSAKAWKNIHPLASFNLSLLYRYKFSDRLFLYCSAQYKQHLVPLGYNSMKLNRFNFQAGIIYRFGREN